MTLGTRHAYRSRRSVRMSMYLVGGCTTYPLARRDRIMTLASSLMVAYTTGQSAGRSDKGSGAKDNFVYYRTHTAKRGTFAYAHAFGYRSAWDAS